MQRLRSMLREYFPAALAAFARAGPSSRADALELLSRGPDPDAGRAADPAKIVAMLRAGGDAGTRETTRRGRSRPRCGPRRCGQPAAVRDRLRRDRRQRRSQLITTLNTPDRRPRARWWSSVLAGTRTLRSTPANRVSASSSAPGCSPSSATTRTATRRQSPQELRRHLADHQRLRHKPSVLARYARNRRLGDALHQWAFCALTRLTRRPRLLRRPPRPQHRPPSRPTPARPTATSASCTAAAPTGAHRRHRRPPHRPVTAGPTTGATGRAHRRRFRTQCHDKPDFHGVGGTDVDPIVTAAHRSSSRAGRPSRLPSPSAVVRLPIDPQLGTSLWTPGLRGWTEHERTGRPAAVVHRTRRSVPGSGDGRRSPSTRGPARPDLRGRRCSTAPTGPTVTAVISL